MTSSYYTPSGKVPPAALPIVALYCLATLPCAWIYAWLMLHGPEVVNGVFTLLYGVLLSIFARQAATRAKVRHPARMALFGTLIGVAGWYFQWAAWIAMAVNLQAPGPGVHLGAFIGLTLRPGVVWHALVDIVQVGTWSLGSHRISGITLGICWLIECALLLGMPRMLARMRSEEPFSERANAWFEKVEVATRFAFIDNALAARAFLERHPQELPSVLAPWSEKASPHHAKVTIHRCRGEDSYLSIDNVTVKVAKKKREESATTVLAYLRLPAIDPDALLRELQEIGSSPAQAPAEDQSQPLAPELEGAVDHLNAGRLDQAFDAALPHVRSMQAGLRIDANRLCAIAASHLGRWDEALSFWHTLFDEEPSAHNALQLATTSVMTGDLAAGTSWLERARTMNADTHEMPPVTLETNYVSALTRSGHVQAAMPCIEQIKACYLTLGVTDPTFLFTRHVPRFDVFLDKSVAIVRASLPGEQARHWYASMLPHLDDRGKAELTEWMKVQMQPG